MDIDLTVNLAAWRFAGWTTMIAFATLCMIYIARADLPRVFCVFLVAVAASWHIFGVQQAFWWRNEELTARGSCKSHGVDYDPAICAAQQAWYAWGDYLTPFAFVGVVITLGVAAAPLLRMTFGLRWWTAGLSAVAWITTVLMIGLYRAAS